MARSNIFILGALLSIASTFGNELPDFASPVATFLSQDNLVTSVRNAVRHAPKTHFNGKIVGKCVKVGGIAAFSGKVKGFTSPRKSIAKLKFHMKGAIATPSMKVGYTVKAGGKLRMSMKKSLPMITFKMKYGGGISGYVKKTLVSGAFHGKFGSEVVGQHVAAKDVGHFRYYFGKKLVTGKWFAAVENKIVKYGIIGKLAGKPFFIKYSTSLNVLFLTANMNPMTVKRTYGKIYLEAGGKSFVHPFDLKGSTAQLPL